jgi:hypothetical protein
MHCGFHGRLLLPVCALYDSQRATFFIVAKKGFAKPTRLPLIKNRIYKQILAIFGA